MEAEITITVHLKGVLGGPVKHTTKQVGKVDVSPVGKAPEWITRKIKHTDRTPVPCARIVPISEATVTGWVKGEGPYWIKPQVWKSFNKKQKIAAYVASFDEGYGVSYE